MGLLPGADGTSQFYSSTPKTQQLCNCERGTHVMVNLAPIPINNCVIVNVAPMPIPVG
jgi:hypothetical protein